MLELQINLRWRIMLKSSFVVRQYDMGLYNMLFDRKVKSGFYDSSFATTHHNPSESLHPSCFIVVVSSKLNSNRTLMQSLPFEKGPHFVAAIFSQLEYVLLMLLYQLRENS